MPNLSMPEKPLDHSPKLRRIADEIKQILIREDVAGIVVLHENPGNGEFIGKTYQVDGMSEYMLHITPSYSKILIEKEGFRFRDVALDNDNPVQRQLRMAPTYNMVTMMVDVLGYVLVPLMSLAEAMRKNIISDKPGKFIPRKS